MTFFYFTFFILSNCGHYKESRNVLYCSLFTDGFERRWGWKVQLGFRRCLKSVPAAVVDLVW